MHSSKPKNEKYMEWTFDTIFLGNCKRHVKVKKQSKEKSSVP
jgi:hypothetical protein